MACSGALKNAAALSFKSFFPLLSRPSPLKQWILSSFDPFIGNETVQASKLAFITSFRRLSQTDKIFSIQHRFEGALIRGAGVISCSVFLPSSHHTLSDTNR